MGASEGDLQGLEEFQRRRRDGEMALWCILSRTSIAAVVPSGCSKRHGDLRRVAQQRVLWRGSRGSKGEQREGEVWVVEMNSSGVTSVSRISGTLQQGRRSCAARLGCVGASASVWWEITRADLGRWMRAF
jgi:hypothetical protein